MTARSPLVTTERLLLGGLIDYAGLFPPAALSMAGAVAQYRSARSGPNAWVLGRFLCPASRLEELAGLLTATLTRGEPRVEIGVVFDSEGSAAAAQAFDAAMGTAAEVALVETRLPPEAADGRSATRAGAVILPHLRAAGSVSPRVSAFLEVPRTDGWRSGFPAVIEAISTLGRTTHQNVGAKLRCGGPTPEDTPTVAEVAAFVAAAATSKVRFKATAGLHHPFRHFDPELGGPRHGFINILTAAALAEAGTDAGTLESVIGDEDAASFSLTASGLGWREHRAGASTVGRMRREAFTAFGSCSFEEPIADLARLELLGDHR